MPVSLYTLREAAKRLSCRTDDVMDEVRRDRARCWLDVPSGVLHTYSPGRRALPSGIIAEPHWGLPSAAVPPRYARAEVRDERLPLSSDEAIRIYEGRPIDTGPPLAEENAVAIEQQGIPIREMLAGAPSAVRLLTTRPGEPQVLIAAAPPRRADLRIARDDVETLRERMSSRPTPPAAGVASTSRRRRLVKFAKDRDARLGRTVRQRAQNLRRGKRKVSLDAVREFVANLAPGEKIAEHVAARFGVNRSTWYRWRKQLQKKTPRRK